MAVLAAIGLTGEFRHRAVTATFLATSHRGRVVVAKLVTYGLVGAGYAIACTAVVAAIALPWLSAKGIHVSCQTTACQAPWWAGSSRSRCSA